MTQHEKLALETSASLSDTMAGIIASNAGIIQLISQHLPNLSDEDRLDLVRQSNSYLGNARQLKQSAAQLRLIVEREQ